jgi:hypothetical protein
MKTQAYPNIFLSEKCLQHHKNKQSDFLLHQVTELDCVNFCGFAAASLNSFGTFHCPAPPNKKKL